MQLAGCGVILKCLKPIEAVPAFIKGFPDEFPVFVVTGLDKRPETEVILRDFYTTQKLPLGPEIADVTGLPRDRTYSDE